MARKKHSPEQIVAILRQIEIAAANSFKSPPMLSQKPVEAIWSQRTRCRNCLRGWERNDTVCRTSASCNRDP